MLTVRTVHESDREMLNQAARSDPFHSAMGLTGEHWMESPEKTLWWEDADGPVVALKTTNVVRADIQFLTQDVERNGRALLEGFWRYVEILSKRGVQEVVFNTQSPDVARFFCKRFGFKAVRSGTYSLRID